MPHPHSQYGITADRYDTIIRAAQTNNELRNQLLAAIEEARGDGSSSY